MRVERGSNKLYRIVKGDGKGLTSDDWKSAALSIPVLLNLAPGLQVERGIGTLWFFNQDEAVLVQKQYEFEVS